MQHSAEFRFYEESNDFLPPAKRKVAFTYRFLNHPSVKDAIEALGVPHTEVNLILVNGILVDFAYQLQDHDRASVYPVFEALDITAVSHVRERPLREPKFILDVHLGRLAKYLRLLGFDTLYENNYADPQLIQLAIAEKRIILTRDIGLLKNKQVTHGYWLRTTYPKSQLFEVIKRFDLLNLIKPFQRCLLCNSRLIPVAKQAIALQLAEKTKLYHEEFLQCSGCDKLYWKGSHFKHMLNFIETIKTMAANE